MVLTVVLVQVVVKRFQRRTETVLAPGLEVIPVTFGKKFDVLYTLYINLPGTKLTHNGLVSWVQKISRQQNIESIFLHYSNAHLWSNPFVYTYFNKKGKEDVMFEERAIGNLMLP